MPRQTLVTRGMMARLISSSSVKKAATFTPPPSSGPVTPPPSQSTMASQASIQQVCEQLLAQGKIVDSTTSPKFLQSLPALDLFSFTMISAMTSSPTLINMATKVMQFTPNFLIKMFVYPLYCGGENFSEVVATGQKLFKRGFRNMMISYSVEDAEGGAQDNSLLNNAVSEIITSIDQILVQHYDNVAQLKAAGATTVAPISGYVALKPTGLMPGSATALKEFNNPEYKQLWENYLDTCRKICRHAAENGQGKVVIVFDAEKKFLQPGVYEAQRIMMREFNRDGNVVVTGTIQMYLQDSLDQLKADLQDAKTHNYQLAHKLVRGAYVHSESDRWNVVHKTKADTDKSYNTGVSIMLDHIIDGWKKVEKLGDKQMSPVGRVIVASHNEESMALVDKRISEVFDKNNNNAVLNVSRDQDESVVFGQLMGMAEDQGEELAKRGHKVIKYVPWGPTKETKEYLIRRLEENGDTVSIGGWTMTKYGVGEIGRRMLKMVGVN